MSEQEILLHHRVGFDLPEELCPLPGVFYGMLMDEYIKLNAMSKSMLHNARRNEHFFLHKLTEKVKEDPAAAAAHFVLGHAIHTSCLEPHLFDNTYAVAPQVNKRTNEGKATLAKFTAAAALKGMEVLTAEQYEQVKGMGESVQKHRKAQDILSGGEAEVTLVDYDLQFGCFRKCRVDWIVDDCIFVDLKSIGRMADEDSIIKQIFDLGYFMQAGMYTDVGTLVLKRPIRDFVFIFVESSPPYQVGIYRVGPKMLSAGISLYRALMARIVESFKRNDWPQYNDDAIVEIEFKPWMTSQLSKFIDHEF